MAISLALLGGIGIIHYNNTVTEQVEQISEVKRYENGFIMNPSVLSPTHTIADVDEIKNKYNFFRDSDYGKWTITFRTRGHCHKSRY